MSLKANSFIKAPAIVNNDAIYFLPKMESSQLSPTINYIMASLSSLCFSVSIFKFSCWVIRRSFAGLSVLFIIITLSCATLPALPSTSEDNFYDPCLCLCLSQFSCLCCSIKFCCCILLFFQCLSFSHLEACIYPCLLKNLLLITHVLAPPDTSQYQWQ